MVVRDGGCGRVGVDKGLKVMYNCRKDNDLIVVYMMGGIGR